MKKAALVALCVLIGAVPGLLITLDNGIGSVNRLIGILAMMVWVVAVVATQRIRRLTNFHLAVFAFSTWYIISLWWALVPSQFDYRATMVQSLVMSVLIWDLIQTRTQLRWAMQAYIFGGYVSTFFTLKSYLAGSRIVEWENRFSALGFDPNDLALLLVLGLPMAMYLATELDKSKKFRLAINLGYPFAALLVITLTGSRGALISAIPAGIFAFFSAKKLIKQAPAYLAAVGGLALLGLTKVNLADSVGRLASVVGSSGGDKLTGRSNLWHGGWVAFGDHPYFGFGAGSYANAAFPYSYWGEKLFAHETYLSILTEEGPIGFLLFAGVLACVVSAIFRMKGRERFMWGSVLASWMIGVSALSWEFRSQTWLFFCLIVTAASVRTPVAVVEIEEECPEISEVQPLAA